MKQFKSESKKLMDMMINSIYTHKEIFLRELISNASDAIDKLYFKSLTDNSVGTKAEDFEIRIDIDKENRILKITDNGCGMTEEELDKNLGTIAKSGSFNFKQENEKTENVDIIGQFGVGFYSAFMVSDNVTVESRAFGSDKAFCWKSKGAEGYSVSECDKQSVGTVVTLHIKDNAEDENYDEFLDQYRISALVKKYSDYIRHPIKMEFTTKEPVDTADGKTPEYKDVTELRTLNSMVPLWKKAKTELSDEDYNNFYKEKFYDFNDPARVVHYKTEGQATYNALLYIPKKPPFDYYTKEFEKGLQLYCKGVLIMDKCADLLPDYFSFVKGLVDSEDLSLNISREMLQHDGQLKLIAKTLEKKIKGELEKMLSADRDLYEEFFKAFGIQLKFGIYNDYGAHKDILKDLLIFRSSLDKKYVTLKEYTERMGERDTIYYACGETDEKIEMLPQTDAVKEKGYEILYLTENVDEFALMMLGEYNGKKFMNICDDKLDLDTEDEKKALESENEAAKDMFTLMKESVGDKINAVRFTNKLKKHPVCLTSEGGISLEMEKTLNSMPTVADNKVKAQLVLEINAAHPIAEKLKNLYKDDTETLKKYAKLLYGEACLIGGTNLDDPVEHSNLVCELMTK
ncbi:MAG: molecular chaperone HtpG [Clostridia bacterium]|nr:molecular chaperone HtpG [Clostridia bacterium]